MLKYCSCFPRSSDTDILCIMICLKLKMHCPTGVYERLRTQSKDVEHSNEEGGCVDAAVLLIVQRRDSSTQCHSHQALQSRTATPSHASCLL